MVITRYGGENKKDNTPLCLALGFFDSLHKGHAAVINSALDFARSRGYLCAVFTFDNNPFEALAKDAGLVYTFPERCEILKGMGADMVLAASFDNAFMSVGAEEFLDGLIKRHNIKFISCGYDYTFGAGGAGGARLLKDFCGKYGIALEVCPEITIDGIKVSSTFIRARIAEGDIPAANRFLSAPYCVYGRVDKGRGVGGRLTYPTANIAVGAGKQPLGTGVYATNTYAGDRKYISVTNAGSKPTFSESSYGIETHIIGHNPDLYGEYIKVEFIKKIRDVMPFPSAGQLKNQIAEDINKREVMEY